MARAGAAMDRLRRIAVGVGAASSSEQLETLELSLKAAQKEQRDASALVAELTQQKNELLQKPTPMEAYMFDKDGL